MIAAIERDVAGAQVVQLRFEHVGAAGQQVTISIAAPATSPARKAMSSRPTAR